MKRTTLNPGLKEKPKHQKSHYTKLGKALFLIGKTFVSTPSKTNTIVRCLRTVCEERTAQEPRTACSGELGFRRLSVRLSTHFEIIKGHRFIIFRRAFPASLVVDLTNLNKIQMIMEQGKDI